MANEEKRLGKNRSRLEDPFHDYKTLNVMSGYRKGLDIQKMNFQQTQDLIHHRRRQIRRGSDSY